MHRNILIAVNESEHSRRALDWYLDVIRIPGDQVLLAHVIDKSGVIPMPTLAHGPTCTRDEWDNIMKDLECQARTVTESSEKRLDEFMAEHEGKTEEIQYQTIFCCGNVGEAICKMAEDNDVDMVIIGNRGMGTIRRTLLGSISDHIVQHSHIPVLVVPPKI